MDPLSLLPFPPARFYAVAQMDPLTMVRDLGLDDPETLQAVEGLHPKKYLVYVDMALDLPMPTSKWCRYTINLIASTLCPEDRHRGILPDMVIPIFPNTQCSSETRSPIHSLRDFPFPNCFYWLESLSYIRMRRHSPDVDTSRTIRLDWKHSHAILRTFRQDRDRMNALRSQSQRGSDDSPPTTTASEVEYLDAVPKWALQDPTVQEACTPIDFSEKRRPVKADTVLQDPLRPTSLGPLFDSDATPSTSLSGSDSEKGGSEDEKELKSTVGDKLDLSTSVADVFMLNILGWDPDPTFPLIPLVDVWFDLEEHLTAENIPSPLEWFEEEKSVNAIIRNAFARRKAAIDSNFSTPVSSEDENASAEESTSTPAASVADQQGGEEGLSELVKGERESRPETRGETLGAAEPHEGSRFKSMQLLHALGSTLRGFFRVTGRALCFRPRDDNLNSAAVSR